MADNLVSQTVEIQAPEGILAITIARNSRGPMGVAVAVELGKEDSELAYMATALSSMITLCLNLSTLNPEVLLEEVIHQLEEIGGSRTIGFGPNKVLSMPDAIAKVLRQDALKHAVRPHKKARKAKKA